eukprot:15017000-Ditylum_brightwellii.AAC.1
MILKDHFLQVQCAIDGHSTIKGNFCAQAKHSNASKLDRQSEERWKSVVDNVNIEEQWDQLLSEPKKMAGWAK